jgi:hypothetical protein
MLLAGLPAELRAAQHIRVNAEKDSQVATRIVQRWRTPNNPISNTIGSTNKKLDLLISAPYADKLPLKVAELIRQNIPFAVLVPLPLLNEIDRIGKNEVDPTVRERRQKMKLIISSSLGQAWLINHPKCRVDNDQHVVYFTQCASNPELERVSGEIFISWYAQDILSGDAAVLPRTIAHSQDIDVLALSAIISATLRGRRTKEASKTEEIR